MRACVCVGICVNLRVRVYMCVCLCMGIWRSGCSLLENHYLVVGYLFFISTSIHRKSQQFSKVSCDQNI